MKNVFVTKLVSPNLKAKAQGTYDGTYGKAEDDAKKVETSVVDGVKAEDKEPKKEETSVVDAVKAEAIVKDSNVGGNKPDTGKDEVHDQVSCSHCAGTGKVAKGKAEAEEPKKEETSVVDAVKAEDAEPKKEQGTGGTYDGTYGKAEDKKDDKEEDETPAKKAARILNSKVSLDQLLGRKEIPKSKWEKNMTSIINELQSHPLLNGKQLATSVELPAKKAGAGIPLPSNIKI